MKIFIIGLIFGLSIQPIMDGITTLILSFFEMIKSYMVVKTAKNNHKINELSAGTSTTHAIGFMANYEEETDEEDDDI